MSLFALGCEHTLGAGMCACRAGMDSLYYIYMYGIYYGFLLDLSMFCFLGCELCVRRRAFGIV